jgi:tetratricopeptide (TPR) repeat protein
MLGLCHFEQMPKTSERDQQPAQESLATFKILLSRFPQSAYAKDAENKVQIISNKLAAKELSVGRFYQSKGNFIAAINRFQVILTNFGKTAYVPEALHRMVESYLSTGLIEEAKQAATQLNTQYKGNEWTGYANKILSERGVQLNLSAPATIVDKNQINKNQTNKDGSQVVNPLDVKNKNTQPSIKNPSPKASSAMPKNASGKKAAQKPIKTAAKKVTKKAKTKAPKKKLKSQNTAQTAVPQTVVAAKEQANKTEMVDF